MKTVTIRMAAWAATPLRRAPGARLLIGAILAVAVALALAVAPTDAADAQANPEGIDVASHQGNVDWGAVAGAGIRFAFVKATEGTGYENPYFAQQYVGSYDAGLIRGAYHYGLPNASSGAAQADYFVDNGGAWSADNQTLPGVLDIEWNPYGATCYGLSASQMVAWIGDFTARYKERTGRDAVIYTAASWWNQCTGNSTAFGSTNPLWVAHYGVDSPNLPAGWGFHTFWQYTSTGSVPGVSGNVDRNVFNGDESRLLALADNT